MRAHTQPSILKMTIQFDLFKAQSLIIRGEIIGNRCLKEMLVKIVLKQVDYSLSISMR